MKRPRGILASWVAPVLASATATIALASPPGLVGAYPFDEGAGASTADLSGFSNFGVVQGAVWTGGGKFGGALAFNGTSARVVVADAGSLDLGAGMTLEAWVQPTVAPSGWSTIVHKETDAYYLAAGSVLNVPAGGGTLGTGDVNAYAASSLPANIWTHLAVTYDGAALRLYVNGAQASSQAATGALVSSSGPLSIGGNGPYGEYFNGRIDEVRIYNRALAPAEIQADMITPIGSVGVGAPKLVLTLPVEGATIQGTTVDGAYATTGNLAEADHVHLQVDDEAVVDDPGLGGLLQLSAVHVGSHALTGWLVRADHSKIAESDAAPVHFMSVVSPSDPVAPTVSIGAPQAGATVTGVTTLTATAQDDVAVYGVQFKLDGARLGAEDLSPPHATVWATTGTPNGTHSVTAVARDVAGNETTSATVAVTVSNAGSNDPSLVGRWAGPYAWPLVAVHATLMPSGKVLLWDDHTDNSGVQVWDPVTDTMSAPPYVDRALFCSGHVVLTDGRVLAVGGQLSSNVGVKEANLFDPATQAWSTGANMHYGRYYPTATLLPDGRVLATGGADNCPTCGDSGGSHDGLALIPEIYDPVANNWSRLTGASLSLPMYPHMFVVPDGRVLAVGSAEDPIASRALDVERETWTIVDPTVRDGGSAVMFRPGKILKTGSARNPNYPVAAAAATAYVLDTNLAEPSWRAVTPMALARTQHNLTVLPDGNVLVVGGGPNSDAYQTAAAAKPAELWSPVTEAWTTMASMSEPRLYHATALLLPDARVLVAGGGRFGPDYPSGELFSPPYLFKGARPTITSAPAVVPYHSHLTVGTPDGARVATVSLVALGSVTHAFNQTQRYAELPFAPVAGGLDVTAPTNPNAVPPGYHMLFLVDDAGVPSVAAIVRIPAPWEDDVPPSAPTNLAGSLSPGRVLLTWTAATDNVGVVRYNIHRASTSNEAPSPANKIGVSATTSFSDTGFASGTFFYTVTAEDAAANVGPASNTVRRTVTADATPPTVALTAPAPGSILSGVVAVAAAASDDVGVSGVQFVLDGAALGAEDTSAPFTVDWNTNQAANGAHVLSAIARDARGNTTTSAGVAVTVTNGTIPGLAAAYAFDEGAGTIARDASGNTNRGTLTGATWTFAGHSGGALSYDGASDYVQVQNSPSINVSGKGLTIEMWANITAGGGVDYVLLAKPWTNGSTASPSYQYAIEFDANGGRTLDFYLSDTTGTRRGPYQMTPVTGAWTHLAYTFDGTAVKGYLDGVLTIAAPLDADIQGRASHLLIGADGGFGQSFRGKLDDVRIYSRALTQAEIQTDRGRPVPPAVPPVPDGTFGAAMKPARQSADGSSIAVSWDVGGCAAKGYHALYGPLAAVSSYQLAGGVCGLGTAGSYVWTGVPVGDLWFVVVADDPGGTEGSWGTRSPGGAINGTTASGLCGATARVNLSACP